MANPSEEIKNLKQLAADAKAEMDRLVGSTQGLERDAIKANEKYREQVRILRDVNQQISEALSNQKLSVQSIISQEKALKGLTGLQASLVDKDRKRLELQDKIDGSHAKTHDAINSIASLNQELLSLSAEDVIAKTKIEKQISDQLYDLIGMEGVTDDIVENLMAQLDKAKGIAKMSETQQKFLNKQLETYQSIKDTIGGILDTAELLMSTTGGKFGAALMGAGYAADKLGETIKAMGGYMGGVTFSTTALGLVFKDAQQTAEALNRELGGMQDVTFGTQLNTNLMAMNMGISGDEAASLTGNFARLNGNSTSIAADMAASTKALAKQKGVMPSAVMKDVARSAKAFAEYGKDGGKNIAEAAVAAARLGVNMDSMTKVTDSLLDFEESINNELELGAMLGRSINLNKARALAFDGEIGAAVKETLNQMGGIAEWEKMNVFQKRQAAKTLGLSVEEMDKMVQNQEKLNDDGTMQLSTFEAIQESLTAFATTGLGSALKGMGAMVIAAGQLNMGFGAMGLSLKGMVGGTFQILKNLIGMLMPTKVLAATKAFGSWLGNSKVGQFIGGIKDKLMGGVKDKMMEKSPIEDATKTTEASDKVAEGKSVGEKLKDLAGGLKEMGNTKVLFGALNLIPTGLGFLAMLPGLPTLFVLSKMDISKVGEGLTKLAEGLTEMASGKVFLGSLSLVAAGVGFALMTVGAVGLAAVALLGVPAGVGLGGIASGLKALGNSGLKGVLVFALLAGSIALSALAFQQFAGVDWASVLYGGIALAGFAVLAAVIGKFASQIIVGALAIALLGIALIPFTFAMSLLAGLSMESVIAAAAGLVIFAGAVFALGAIMFSGVGALVFGAGLLALIGLGLAMMVLGTGLLVAGAGFQAIGDSMGSIVATISQVGTVIGGLFQYIAPIAALALALVGLAAALTLVGVAGIAALPGLMAVAAVGTVAMGIGSMLGLGGGEGSESEKESQTVKMDELIAEIKGLRADMQAGKIAVIMDGNKVTSKISSVVDKQTGNSFRHT